MTYTPEQEQHRITTEYAVHQRETYGIPRREFEAWIAHRDNAKRRGIPFRFSLLQWRVWWRLNLPAGSSRGRKRGQYVMARLGDRGAYEAGNVECITQASNLRAMDRLTLSQAIKAAHARRKAAGIPHHFTANRTIHPRARPVTTPLGSFASAALASEAHGITGTHAARLAKGGVKGWCYT